MKGRTMSLSPQQAAFVPNNNINAQNYDKNRQGQRPSLLKAAAVLGVGGFGVEFIGRNIADKVTLSKNNGDLSKTLGQYTSKLDKAGNFITRWWHGGGVERAKGLIENGGKKIRWWGNTKEALWGGVIIAAAAGVAGFLGNMLSQKD